MTLQGAKHGFDRLLKIEEHFDMEITEENWKEHRELEAKRLFPLESLVQYTHGFMRFDQNNFGQVMRITKTGTVYVAQVALKEVRRNPVKDPAAYQLGGWIDYNPKKFKLLDGDPLKFLARLYASKTWDKNKKNGSRDYFIKWNGASDTGNYLLRPLEIGDNGLVRATHDGCS